MLSEKEEKAIERLDRIEVYNTGDGEAIDIVLNLITKLQKESEEKDNRVRKIINRLDNDIFRISKSKEINRWDDYRICRLKAYRTKTREIKEYIEQEYFEKLTKEKG